MLNHCFIYKVMVGCAAFFFTAAAMSDEVIDTINSAVAQYNEGKYAESAGNLDYAAQLIRQKKGSNLQKFLPQALEGWQAEDAKSDSVATAMFGGGLTAERRYTRNQDAVTVKIITDSPMLQSMMMIFQNPMLATADGGKILKIKDQKAIVKCHPSDKTGEITIVVANQFLIQISGDGVTEEEMTAYAGAMDFAGLQTLS